MEICNLWGKGSVQKQEQGATSVHNCDIVHNMDGEVEEIPDQSKAIHIEGSPILVHVKTKEGGPVLTNFFLTRNNWRNQ